MLPVRRLQFIILAVEEGGREGEGRERVTMGRHASRAGSSIPPSDVLDAPDQIPDMVDAEIQWPFGRIDSLTSSDLRDTAYEIFFMSCRSSPGFAGRSALSYYSAAPAADQDGASLHVAAASGEISPRTGMMTVTSRIKKSLGLKMGRSSPMRPMSSGGTVQQPHSPGNKVKRPMTSAEIMRQQMKVTEQGDNRLRKTLIRAFVGQTGRRAETIVLPLELLRQLKASEFSDMYEYHQWQRRQLRVLEAGLLLHPSTQLDRSSNVAAAQLNEVLRVSEVKPLDTSKHSDVMRTICASVVALAWRNSNSAAVAAAPSSDQSCHWADGFPLNIYLYLALLQSIFDIRDETMVLDEVDELVELMKKTWSTLGINRATHNVCFTWVFFHQYVVTGQVEQELAGAAVSMLTEVANDSVRLADRDPVYSRVLSAALATILRWGEKRLLDYHDCFDRITAGDLDIVINLAISTSNIVGHDPAGEPESRVDRYIRSSIKHAFARALESVDSENLATELEEEPCDIIAHLAKHTEELIVLEKDTFTPTLKRWHAVPLAAAAATLHGCFGVVLKQYLARVTTLTNDLLQVLQCAGKLEKVLVQLVVEDTADCDDGGKNVVREMVPYELDSIVSSFLKAFLSTSAAFLRGSSL